MNSENINPIDQNIPTYGQDQFNSQPQYQSVNNTATYEGPAEGKRSWVKMVLAILVVIAISSASVFAYQQYVKNQVDPLTLLNESALANTKRYMEGNFKTDVIVGITQSDLLKPGTSMSIELPMSIAVEKYIEGAVSNMHIQVGNIDLGPVFLSLGAPAEMVRALNNQLNFEFIIDNKGVYVKINSFPEALNMFMPIPEKYLNQWLYAESESATGIATMFSGLDIQTYLTMGEENSNDKREEIEYAVEKLTAALLSETEAEFKLSSKGGLYNLKYQIGLAELVKIMNIVGSDVSNKYPEFTFVPQDEDVEGMLNFEMNINKSDKLIPNLNYSATTTFETVDMEFDMSVTNDFEQEVKIEIPTSSLKIEDLMMELFGSGM